MPADGWEDALLLGPLSRFFTLSLIAFFPCLFLYSFVQIPPVPRKTKTGLEHSPYLVIVDCLDILRHYVVLKGNISDI